MARKTRRQAIFERWTRSKNRDMNSASYKDEWYPQQCFSCVHYIGLEPPWGADFGVCSHAASNFDGRVRFEHDGCELHKSKKP